MIERSYLLVKPDGMIGRGCDDAILDLSQKGLIIEGFKRVTLDRDQVAEMYPEKVGSPFEKDLHDYMTSGECGVILVRGEGAIGKVREAKGKTWSSGLRLSHANNFIHNTFHCPDGNEERDRELKILLKRLEKKNET